MGKRLIKTLSVLCVIISMTMMLFGCIAEQSKTDTAANDEIVLAGLVQGDQIMTQDDIKALEPYEGHVKGTDSKGNVLEFEIKGGRLSDLLAQYGIKQADLSGVRLTASDGYAIEIPHEILAKRDVILAYETDGQPLDKDSAPIHVFIPEERSMYWVRMLSKIEVIEAEPSEAVTAVTIIESLYGKDDYCDYELNGQTYAALDMQKILSGSDDSDTVRMIAADGLQKNETRENLYKGVIQMEGSDAPQFASSELPIGMFVKKLLVIQSGGQAFYFLSSAETNGSVSVEKIMEDCGLKKADEYVLRYDDGSEETAALEELKTLAVQTDGTVISKDGQPKLISIILGG